MLTILLMPIIALLYLPLAFCLTFQAHSFARFFLYFYETEQLKTNIFFIIFIVLKYLFFNFFQSLLFVKLYNFMIILGNWGIFILIFCIINIFSSRANVQEDAICILFIIFYFSLTIELVSPLHHPFLTSKYQVKSQALLSCDDRDCHR